MLQEIKPSHSSSHEWKLPLNLAIAFHVILIAAVFYLPGMFKSKPRFEDIYTVNLVNLAEVADTQPAQEAASETKPSPPPKTQKTAQDSAIPIAEKPPAADAAARPEPPKAISIKPSKRKVKKKLVKSSPQPQESELDRQRRQRLAEMIHAEQAAAEQAQILAEEAALEKQLAEEAQRRLSEAEAQRDKMNTQPAQPNGNSTLRGSNRLSALQTQYYASVTSRLHSYWSVPEYMSRQLQATVIITVAADGSIINSFFESRSGDRIFDNFVTKTLQDVGKLPPIPPVFNTQRMEIGLKFSPAGIR